MRIVSLCDGRWGQFYRGTQKARLISSAVPLYAQVKFYLCIWGVYSEGLTDLLLQSGVFICVTKTASCIIAA